MAELTGWPTDGAEGSVSSEARWRKMARLWAPSGVATGLVPTLGSGVINVTAGAAWVDGHYAELTSPASESSTANGSAGRPVHPRRQPVRGGLPGRGDHPNPIRRGLGIAYCLNDRGGSG